MNKIKVSALFVCLGLIIMAGSLTGCGGSSLEQGPQGVQGPAGPAGPQGAPSPTPSPNAISEAVSNFNTYIENSGANGGHMLQPGLECTLYTVPNMPSKPCLSTNSGISGCTQLSTTGGFAGVQSFVFTGEFNQPNEAGTSGFNVLPTNLQSYSTDFELVCTGYIVIPDYEGHKFSVTSDDGSLLYVNGSLIVNNDGLHSATTVSGNSKPSNAQVFSVQVDYFQGPGSVALVVDMDGNLLPSTILYH